MTDNSTPRPPASVALTGKMLQMNITLLILVALILGPLYMASKATNPVVVYGGIGVALVALLLVVFFVPFFYLRQSPRPLDEPAAIKFRGLSGAEITIQNPPDSLFEKGELNALARSMLVGFDENLCPDGYIVGKASDGNFVRYSEQQKTEFMKQHREEIKNKKIKASKLLSSTEAVEQQGELLPEVETTNVTQDEKTEGQTNTKFV
jgi:hypothetical protein